MKHYLTWEFNLHNGIGSAIWKLRNQKVDEMTITGITIFTGPQGSGKTLSMVHYAKPIIKDNPKAIIVTNFDIKYLKDFPNEVRPYEGFKSFEIENGIYGVIYLLDEIHLILNSLESKGVPLSVIVELSQQRKQRKLILGSSQVYSRMAKPLREQIQNVIVCKNYFGVLQFNYLINAFETEEVDGKLKVKKCKTSFFFHRKEDYLNYDTYKKMAMYVGINNNTSNYN